MTTTLASSSSAAPPRFGSTTEMQSTIKHLSDLFDATKRQFEASNTAGLTSDRSYAYQPLHSAAPSELNASSALAAAVASAAAAAAAGGSASGLLDDQLDGQLQSYLSPEMSLIERHFWFFLFFAMVLVAAGGNMIVVYIVSTNRDMKSVTNYFLVNLSLADTMVSTLNVIFNFISMVNGTWPFGLLYCKISNFIAILSISASVFTLTAISCDRLRMSHRHAIAWILLIWSLSVVLALPNAIYSSLVEDKVASESVAVACTMIWPDGRYPLSLYDHIYNIMLFVVIYLVPIITMAVLYYKVGRELWGYEAIGENIEKQRRALMAKKKIVKMMIVVVIIFALCWFPYHAFFVVNYYLPNIFVETPLHYQRFYLLMYWFAMSNSMYNPIIIYFMNSKFRHEIRSCLCFIFCCRSYRLNGSSNSSNNNMIGRHYSSQFSNATPGAQSKRATICDNGQVTTYRQRNSINSRRSLADRSAESFNKTDKTGSGPGRQSQRQAGGRLASQQEIDGTVPATQLACTAVVIAGPADAPSSKPRASASGQDAKTELETSRESRPNAPLTNESPAKTPMAAVVTNQREAPAMGASRQHQQGHCGGARMDMAEMEPTNGMSPRGNNVAERGQLDFGELENAADSDSRPVEANDVEESKPFITGQSDLTSDETMTVFQDLAEHGDNVIHLEKANMYLGKANCSRHKRDASSGQKVWI